MKMLMNLIFTRFLHEFWGPLLHFLVPKSKLKDQPTSRLHQLFAYSKLAFSLVKDDFDELMESEDMTTATTSVMTNLEDLFTFYIPLVSLLCSSFPLFFWLFACTVYPNPTCLTCGSSPFPVS